MPLIYVIIALIAAIFGLARCDLDHSIPPRTGQLLVSHR